jgi:predicted lipid-binding transport protein (Tim44 family)
MSATPEPIKCNSKNCNDPSVTGKASCARHLKAASNRMSRLREDRKVAAQKSKNSTSMMPKDPFQGNDASKTRPALQVISVNGDGAIPAKRKRPENDSSSEEEASLVSGKVSGDLSMGGSHRSTGR